MKKLVIIILVIILISTPVYPFSLTDWLEEFNDFMTGFLIKPSPEPQPETCATGTYKIQAQGIVYEEGGDNQLTNLNVFACCSNANDCVDANGNCYNARSLRDADNDKEYCSSSNNKWYEVDSYRIGETVNNVKYPGKEKGEYPFHNLCVLAVGAGRWNIGGDAVSAKNDANGYNHCCGDDTNEYYIKGSDNSVACCSSANVLVVNGACNTTTQPTQFVECETDIDCQAGYKCINNKCVKIVECKSDKDCKEDYVCYDNRCYNTKCIDSDNGEDPYVKGTVSIFFQQNNEYAEVSDYCLDKNNLVEIFCREDTEDSFLAEHKTCWFGCEDGTCIKEITNCGDSTLAGECNSNLQYCGYGETLIKNGGFEVII